MRLRNALRRLYRELIPLLYGRSNYKMFLQRTFEALDRRSAAILGVMNVLPAFIKPIPVKAPFGKSMLVVAPHHDDEIIGCGGAMLLQLRAGRSVHVVFTQDGGDEHAEDGRTREEQISVREEEALEVARQMGIPAPTFLRKVSLAGAEAEQLADELLAEIEKTKADVVMTPFVLDYNTQHQRTNFALAEAIARLPRSIKVMCYEVWGLTVPNVVLNIDDVQSEKARLLDLYVSQVSGTDYVHAITGLNMYHSIHFGAHECKYAERYFEVPGQEFVDIMRTIRGKITDADPLQPTPAF